MTKIKDFAAAISGLRNADVLLTDIADFLSADCELSLRYSLLKVKHASDLLDPEDGALSGFRRFAPP